MAAAAVTMRAVFQPCTTPAGHCYQRRGAPSREKLRARVRPLLASCQLARRPVSPVCAAVCPRLWLHGARARPSKVLDNLPPRLPCILFPPSAPRRGRQEREGRKNEKLEGKRGAISRVECRWIFSRRRRRRRRRRKAEQIPSFFARRTLRAPLCLCIELLSTGF